MTYLERHYVVQAMRRRFRRRVRLAFKAWGYLGTLALGRSPRRQRLDWE